VVRCAGPGPARLDRAPGPHGRLPGRARGRPLTPAPMKITPLSIPDVVLIEPQVHGDARGYFFESYNAARFAAALGREPAFVQDNQSRSSRHVVRGLHYQI